jgi:hypothetical protein
MIEVAKLISDLQRKFTPRLCYWRGYAMNEDINLSSRAGFGIASTKHCSCIALV